MSRSLLLSLALIGAVVLGACQRSLVATPRIMVDEGPSAFDGVPEFLRTPEMPIVYATDRASDRDSPRGPVYREKRSIDLIYGLATVTPSLDVTWDELVVDSTSNKRKHRYKPRVSTIEPRGQISYLGNRLTVEDGRLLYTDEAIQDAIDEANELNAMLDPWIEAGNDEVLIYVHGVANSFDDAITRTAELWHFTGRKFIPIAYTWPSVTSFGFFEYVRDYETSTFTVMHLKMLLATLALNPKIKRVHIVAHSRGTDIASNAVRELYIQYERGGNRRVGEPEPVRERIADRFKIHTLILAAPDIDRDVFVQRFFAENAAMGPDRFIMYFSKRDAAIGVSNWLFKGDQRMGKFRVEDMNERSRETLAQIPGIELVDCDVTEGPSSHAYLFEHPGALSDLILVLRDDVYAADARRPLAQPAPGLWRLDDNYLLPESP